MKKILSINPGFRNLGYVLAWMQSLAQTTANEDGKCLQNLTKVIMKQAGVYALIEETADISRFFKTINLLSEAHSVSLNL